MQLYAQTQARLFRQMNESMNALLDAKPRILQFEDLCSDLRRLGHEFEPVVDTTFGHVLYTINTTPSRAGEMMLALCGLGCTEVGSESIDEHGSMLYAIQSDRTPRFNLSVSKFNMAPPLSVAQAAGRCVACEMI